MWCLETLITECTERVTWVSYWIHFNHNVQTSHAFDLQIAESLVSPLAPPTLQNSLGSNTADNRPFFLLCQTRFLPHLWESRRGSLWALLYESLDGWWSLAASSSPRWRRWFGPASACRCRRSRAGSLAQSGARCRNRHVCAAQQLRTTKGSLNELNNVTGSKLK